MRWRGRWRIIYYDFPVYGRRTYSVGGTIHRKRYTVMIGATCCTGARKVAGETNGREGETGNERWVRDGRHGMSKGPEIPLIEQRAQKWGRKRRHKSLRGIPGSGTVRCKTGMYNGDDG